MHETGYLCHSQVGPTMWLVSVTALTGDVPTGLAVNTCLSPHLVVRVTTNSRSLHPLNTCQHGHVYLWLASTELWFRSFTMLTRVPHGQIEYTAMCAVGQCLYCPGQYMLVTVSRFITNLINIPMCIFSS